MRGSRLAVLIWIVALCGAGLAQRVQFVPANETAILERMTNIPADNRERAVELKALFSEAGCSGNALAEQPVDGVEIPNITCRLHGAGNDTIIVGAHYERVSSAQRPLDNWSGASLLPALYQCLKGKKRQHNFIFVAFADQGNDPAGAEFFTRHMGQPELDRTDAMINVDALGLSPTKFSVAHSDKDLVHDLVVMVYALKLPASQIDIAAAGNTDSEPFALRRVPQITVHSLTKQNVVSGETTQFRPNNYYDTYRLLCGYLAYLDQTLKPRPH
jgi:hypothetical protein